ncbi:MAG TPA: hypothetical protein VE988_26185, partial [Gemmataceae bacterium]|nr:hypothetical protein [Gemmataceae bacterium]
MNNHIPPRWLSLASFRPFFRGLGQRLLLIGPLGLILLIAGGWLGDDFGVPELFWHTTMLKQALVGFAVALLFAETCLVSYLLDAPKPWLAGLPEPAPEGWRRKLSGLADSVLRLLVPQPKEGAANTQQWRQLRWYLSVTWLPLLAVLAVLALRYASLRWGFLAGLAVALIVVGVFVWVFQHLDASGWNERMHRLI